MPPRACSPRPARQGRGWEEGRGEGADNGRCGRRGGVAPVAAAGGEGMGREGGRPRAAMARGRGGRPWPGGRGGPPWPWPEPSRALPPHVLPTEPPPRRLHPAPPRHAASRSAPLHVLPAESPPRQLREAGAGTGLRAPAMDATTHARRSHDEVEVRRGGRFAAVGEGESAGGGVSSRGWGGAGEGGGWRTRAPSGSSPAAAAGLVPHHRRKQRWARPAKREPCRTGRTRSSRPP